MTGFNVAIDEILLLADKNYRIAENYAEITNKLGDTDDAEPHLTDHDGEPTKGDSEVVALLAEFESYLKTTTARYYLTAEQLEKAARRYIDQENLHSEQMDDMLKGLPDYDLQWDPDKTAQDTDRPDAANDEQAAEFGTDEDPAEPDHDGERYLEELDDSTEEERDR